MPPRNQLLQNPASDHPARTHQSNPHLQKNLRSPDAREPERDSTNRPVSYPASRNSLTLICSNDHLVGMARVPPTTRQSIPCPEEVVFVELMRCADLLSRAPAQFLKEQDLSPNQYNVLRILRGAPEGLLCGEIACRMISRDPDITRLLDRLEKRALIGRCREDPDRRKVLVRITPAGIALLAHLHKPVCDLHHRQLGHLSQNQLRQLERLLLAAREVALPTRL